MLWILRNLAYFQRKITFAKKKKRINPNCRSVEPPFPNAIKNSAIQGHNKKRGKGLKKKKKSDEILCVLLKMI